MKKTTKKLGLALAFLFALSTLIVGCGSQGSTSAPATTQTAAPATNASVASASTAQTLKPYEIIFAYPGDETKDMKAVQDAMSKITQEKISATIKLMPISWSAWAQQTTLMIAGGEKIDAIFTSNYFNYDSVVAKGELLPIEDLLKKYGQDITKTVEPDLLNCSGIGGHLYAVPSMRDFAADFGVALRKDIVDKYGIDTSKIKTYADLTDVFKLVKEKEPGMMPLVKGDDTTTFVEQTISGTFDRLDNWFGVLPMASGDMKVVDMYETKEYSDALNLVRGWFTAGYISKDVATSKEQGVDIVKSGKGFAMLVPMKPGAELRWSNPCATEMLCLRFTPPITNTSNIANVMTSISKTTGDADRTMMFLNLMYSDKDLVNLYDNGVENLDYVKTSDTAIDYPTGLSAANTGYPSNNWMVGNNFLSYIWKGDDPNLWTKMSDFNKSSVRSKALGFSFNVDPVKTEVAAVANVQSQYKMGLETGTLDPAKVLPEFVSKLKAAGLEKIITEKQTQLDAWAAAK
ncbi:MAG TPA: ABC transporter substrate-binding protein [Clostridia bacterium]|nr:ABC transporter substrate-binding protein [Clostridia bacterium]